jgi:hypothetical protein
MPGLIALLLLCATVCPLARAADLTNGVMLALPTPAGRAPAIDGDLRDWDLSAAEPTWLAPETVHLYQASLALLYDADALYVGVQAVLPNRPLRNPNNPQDAFWSGDIVQLRLVSDPTLPWPMDGRPACVESPRVLHLSLWKNTETNVDFLHLNTGMRFNKGQVLNPPGSKVVITQGRNAFTLEARVPWSALNVPDGKNPFAAGGRMTGIFEVLWGDNTYRVAAVYGKNPGVFAFSHPETWGRVEFSPTGHIAPRHETMLQALAKLAPKAIGMPITVTVPEKMKLSVNILGPTGEVVRELLCGETRPAGKTTVHWDGRDQWGAPLAPGTYRWGAYLSRGLRADYMGSVGCSGTPPYDTADGTGGWGGDHGAPVDVAADATGLYFLWMVAEAGRAVVKTDDAGKVLWRKTPFVGGGFGPFYTLAGNGKSLFLVFGESKPQLAKLDAATGRLLTFTTAPTVAISDGTAVKVPPESVPFPQPECIGLACDAQTVYASAYAKNAIRLFNAETGAHLRDLPCPGPRGIALAANGDLYAVSNLYDHAPCVVVYRGGVEPPELVITTDLLAPWDVAVDAAGRLHVTDLAASQQVKVFTADGTLLRTLGKPGGRAWAGKYDPTSLLRPAGIAADPRGGILLAEAAIPKVMSRFDAATGTLRQRWFGDRSYAPTNIPDPTDPWTQYYSTSGGGEGFARARIPQPGGTGLPTAYWVLPDSGFPHVGPVLDTMNVPELLIAKNGKQYLVSDSSPHGICRVQGDTVTPVGAIRVTNWQKEAPGLEIWSDANGDGQPQSALAADVEVLLSGQGARGLQTVSRNYLFSARTAQTTMVDDLPTEARMYPEFWGTATVE